MLTLTVRIYNPQCLPAPPPTELASLSFVVKTPLLLCQSRTRLYVSLCGLLRALFSSFFTLYFVPTSSLILRILTAICSLCEKLFDPQKYNRLQKPNSKNIFPFISTSTNTANSVVYFSLIILPRQLHSCRARQKMAAIDQSLAGLHNNEVSPLDCCIR